MLKHFSLSLILLAFVRGSFSEQADGNQRLLRGGRRDGRQSIAGIAGSEPNFSTLVSVLVAAGLDRALDCRWSRWCTKYTVFAPTNDAFNELAQDQGDFFTVLTTETDYALHLRELLLYHIVKGSVESTDVQPGSVKSLAEEQQLLYNTEAGIKVNDANVIDPFDVKAKNGIIHSVDEVLIPTFITDDIPTVATKNPDFSILVEALGKAGLIDALKGERLTVFAPTNSAFERLEQETGITVANFNVETLTNVLLYHVLDGTGIVVKSELSDGNVSTLLNEDIRVDVEKSRKSCDIKLNGDVNVVTADVLARNGIVHVIDQVLLPPSITGRSSAQKSIVDVVSEDPNFSILLKAIVAAPGIADALSSGGPFTVFAPTNSAFEKLGLEVVDDLVQNNPEALVDILQYHVLSTAVSSTELPETALVNALNKKGIAIDARKGVTLNGNTHVIDADIETSDGVIHVIDRVLIPPENLVDVLTKDGRFGTLLGAVQQVPGLAEILATKSPLTIFAPTDEAFEKVPSNTLNELLGNEEELTEVLEYHVVSDFVPIQALENTLPTLLTGESISVRARRFWYWWRYWRTYTRITINENIHVEDADILASNGVIHVIDGVLIPM